MKARDPSSPPSKTSMAKAFEARRALAAVAATATPTSFREALTVSLGTAGEETRTAAVDLEAVAEDLRPVKEGMATVAEVTVAMDIE